MKIRDTSYESSTVSEEEEEPMVYNNEVNINQANNSD